LTDIILHQNYPNPFNSTTNINYYLLNSESIKISIYDVLGREVAELYKGWQQSGYHEIQFNTKNISSSLASGIYFYTITTSNQSISKKMILLR
ncbi:MAG: T9SS type A sorting domain-containing protein, partial [Bacteroidetes bacterium]|nr:T9SS type A sorting domain-containing protein [Bacteroidota bacterium]